MNSMNRPPNVWVVGWTEPTKARLSDLVRGEQDGSGAPINLGKFQMLLLTVVSVAGFGMMIGQRFWTQWAKRMVRRSSSDSQS